MRLLAIALLITIHGELGCAAAIPIAKAVAVAGPEVGIPLVLGTLLAALVVNEIDGDVARHSGSEHLSIRQREAGICDVITESGMFTAPCSLVWPPAGETPDEAHVPSHGEGYRGFTVPAYPIDYAPNAVNRGGAARSGRAGN